MKGVLEDGLARWMGEGMGRPRALVSKGGGGVVRGEEKAAEAGGDQTLKGLRY